MMSNGIQCGARLAAVLALIAATIAWAGPVAGPLRIHSGNPRYFDDGTGKAVFLTGSHVWSNLQDELGQPAVDFGAHLGVLQSYGHNFTRGWHWEDAYYTPLPYARTGPGNANDGGLKFDLTQYNQAYFDRVKSRAAEAGRRGMYMSIMLFEGWSLDNAWSSGKPSGSRNPNPWLWHPYHVNNNVNGIDGDPNRDLDGGEIHQLLIPGVTDLQDAYVRKAIDEFNDLDNIIWEISNESRAYAVQWQYHMVNLIRSYESTKPEQHLIWMNARGDWNNSALFNGPADIVSPNNRSGIDYISNPPATTGNKIILLDTDHLVGVGGDRIWVWKSFVRGYQPIYMDPLYDLGWNTTNWNPNDPQYVGARRAMGQVRTYAERINLADTIPQPSGTSIPSSTRYCLYAGQQAYIVYQPTGGAFTLELPEGSYGYEWFEPSAGTVADTGSLVWTGGPRAFAPPFSGDAVLLVQYKGPPPQPGDLDLDGDVDQSDFGIFQECLSGSLVPYGPGCERADLDLNSVVDGADAAMFLNCMGGPDTQPGC